MSAQPARPGWGVRGHPRGCVGDLEGIMNSGAATAFLPNFVGFPSPRGLHSSTVQPWRTPGAHAGHGPSARRTVRPAGARRCAARTRSPVPEARLPRVSCLPASAPAAAARRSAAARRRSAAAGVTPVVVAAVSPRRAGVPAADPPAARTRLGPRGRVRPGRPGRRGRRAVRPVPSAAGLVQRQPRLPAPAGLARREEHHHDHRQDDALRPWRHPPSVPPKRPPVGASRVAASGAVPGGFPAASRRKAELRNSRA